MDVMPVFEIRETGLVELVGANEEVNTNDYGGSVEVKINGGATEPASGILQQFMFYATETGSGAIQDSAGKLLILDADPATTAGDTAITAAERVTVIGEVEIAAFDWTVDANGGSAFVVNQPVYFHEVSSLWFLWFHTDATDLNDGAGDDEILQVNAWFQRYS